MEGIVVYALLNKKLKALASGISSIVPISNGLRFTTTNGTNIDVTLPTHTHSNLDTILEKFTLDGSNKLLFDGQSLDKQLDLTNYVQKETGKGLFTGNYNDLINKPASQQPNKSISFTSSDWVQDAVDLDKYTLEITHGLKTIDIVGVIYNSSGEEETIGFKPLDIDRVRLTNISPTDGRAVLNYTSTINTGTNTGISDLSGFTSDDLSEGTNNKYLTPSEKTIVGSINLTSPSDKQVLSYDSATGNLVNETINDEKVKLTSSSTTAEYIGDLIDNSTIQISGNKIVAKSLQGQTVTLTELNYISGLNENIMTKFSNFLNGGIQVYTTKTFSSYSELLSFNYATLTTGKIYLMYVSKDETHSNNGTTYMCHSTTNTTTNLPYYCGLSTATQRDFGVDKVDLTSEVKNQLPQANIDMIGILKTIDIIDDLTHTDTDKPSSANQVKILKGLVDSKTQTNDIGIAGNLTDTYSIDKIIELLNNKQNKIYTQSTQPSSPTINTIWIDTTNSTNYTIKCYNGTGFIQVGSSGGITIENWSSLTSYISNSSFVIYNSNLYRCKTTHISTMTFESANWDLVGGDVTKTYLETIINTIYPVGHILMTENSANPNTYLGVGTWVAYGAGRVPVGIDGTQTEFNAIGKTGGTTKHTLSIEELPNHTHGYYYPSNTTVGREGGVVAEDTAKGTSYTTLQTSAIGLGQAHNNLSPYVVCYMWKRTV